MTTIDPALMFLEEHLAKLQANILSKQKEQAETIIDGLGEVIKHLMMGLNAVNAVFEEMKDLVLKAADHKFDYHQRDLLETILAEKTIAVNNLMKSCHSLSKPILELSTAIRSEASSKASSKEEE